MSVRSRFAVVLAAASISVLLPAAAAQAQQVTGLEVRQSDGFATLSWDPVDGATDYQIERSAVVNGQPQAAVIVGVWRPNRQVNQDSPAFADAGFIPGDSFQWRVRARFGTTPQPFSAPVSDTTQPKFGDPATPGENLRTEWEQSEAAAFTSDVYEYAYTASLDETTAAIRLMAERARVIAEGAGALAPAAALSGRAGSGKIVCIVSGGNIDFSKLTTILEGGTP